MLGTGKPEQTSQTHAGGFWLYVSPMPSKEGHHIRSGVDGHARVEWRYCSTEDLPGKAAGIEPGLLM